MTRLKLSHFGHIKQKPSFLEKSIMLERGKEKEADQQQSGTGAPLEDLMDQTEVWSV